MATDAAAGAVLKVTAEPRWLLAAGLGLLFMEFTVLVLSYWATSRSGNWRMVVPILALSALVWPLLVVQTDLQLTSYPEVRAALEANKPTPREAYYHSPVRYPTLYFMDMLFETRLDWHVGLVGLVLFITPASLGASAGLKIPGRFIQVDLHVPADGRVLRGSSAGTKHSKNHRANVQPAEPMPMAGSSAPSSVAESLMFWETIAGLPDEGTLDWPPTAVVFARRLVPKLKTLRRDWHVIQEEHEDRSSDFRVVESGELIAVLPPPKPQTTI